MKYETSPTFMITNIWYTAAQLSMKRILWFAEKKRLTWALLLDHIWQIPLVDEENQTSSCKQQEKPQRTRHSPSAPTQGVAHHPPLHPQHDAVQPDANGVSPVENVRQGKEIRRAQVVVSFHLFPFTHSLCFNTFILKM